MACLRIANRLILHTVCIVSIVAFSVVVYIVFSFSLRRPQPFLNFGFYLQIAGLLLLGWAGIDIFRDAYKKCSH